MSQPGTLAWLARHELRLAWRDWLFMMTAGKRSREPKIALGIVAITAFIHLIAYFIVAPIAKAGIAPDKATLVMVTGGAMMSWSVILSQAMESVTRAFYARSDLDLILSSPASARRLFAVRIAAIAFSTTLMAMMLAGPFINVLAVYDGVRWLYAYGVLLGMGAVSAAVAVALTVAMFRALGPKRTRIISQIVAAVVGASFVILIQAVAILSYDSLSRLSFLRSDMLAAMAPDLNSPLWWPARAAMGDGALLALVFGAGLGLLAIAIAVFSARFGDHVIAASSAAYGDSQVRERTDGFRLSSKKRMLRRKEWMLLRRDPWLLSQTLMQILYLLPPALLLWRNFGDNIGALAILVPVLVMASGQLAGGLAWLAVSGEDAPDLVGTAPVTPGAIVWAKIEAVLGSVFVVVAPLLIALAFAAPRIAIVAALGIAASAASATTIQIWFRAQAKRTNFRRRHTSSRIATFSEAFSSVLWAATAGIAAAGSVLSVFAAFIALCILAGVWMIRPRQTATA